MGEDARLFIGQGIRIMAGDKVVGFAKEGMLACSIEDDGSTKDSGAWERPMRHSYEITGEAVVSEVGDTIRELLEGAPRKVDVRLEREPGRMPRKMKKALRARYRRDTKWKRKLANYLGRLCHTLHRAEIVITREQRYRLARHIEMTVRPVDAPAVVSPEKLERVLRKYSDENCIHGCHDCLHWQYGDDGGQCEYADCPVCDDERER